MGVEDCSDEMEEVNSQGEVGDQFRPGYEEKKKYHTNHQEQISETLSKEFKSRCRFMSLLPSQLT